MSQSPSKNEVLETSRSQRHSNYYVLVKSRVATRTVPARLPGNFFDILGGNGDPKGAFLEIPKIENGIKTARWRQNLHWEPLKMLLWEDSDKYMKNQWKINQKRTGFGREKHAKTMKGSSESKFFDFWKKFENWSKKGSQNQSNLIQNGTMGAEGSIRSGSRVDFGAIGRSMIFRLAKIRPKIN